MARAGGLAGHGVVASSICGRTLADLILERESELTSLPWVGHRSRRWEPEPARIVAQRLITDDPRAAPTGSRMRAEGRPGAHRLVARFTPGR